METDKVLLSVQVSPAFRLALRRIALDRGCSVRALVTDALSRLVPTDSRKVTHEQKSFE
jgi:hypothetical protein